MTDPADENPGLPPLGGGRPDNLDDLDVPAPTGGRPDLTPRPVDEIPLDDVAPILHEPIRRFAGYRDVFASSHIALADYPIAVLQDARYQTLAQVVSRQGQRLRAVAESGVAWNLFDLVDAITIDPVTDVELPAVEAAIEVLAQTWNDLPHDQRAHALAHAEQHTPRGNRPDPDSADSLERYLSDLGRRN